MDGTILTSEQLLKYIPAWSSASIARKAVLLTTPVPFENPPIILYVDHGFAARDIGFLTGYLESGSIAWVFDWGFDFNNNRSNPPKLDSESHVIFAKSYGFDPDELRMAVLEHAPDEWKEIQQ